MKARYIIGGIIIIIFIVIGSLSFINSSVEYTTLSQAETSGKKVQVKGSWVKDMETNFDPSTNSFSFYLKDEQDKVSKVVFTGAKPNNFDIATSVVVKGKYKEGTFHASEILTKCPSKYENNTTPKASSM